MTPERLDEIRWIHKMWSKVEECGHDSLRCAGMSDLLAYVDELREQLKYATVKQFQADIEAMGGYKLKPACVGKPQAPCPRIYIAGPMTGKPEWNFPAFFEAAEALKRAGYEPVNPAEAFGGDTSRTHQEYMREACRQLATCQGILLLDGWRESKGATFECCIAHVLGMEFYEQSEPFGLKLDRFYEIVPKTVVPVALDGSGAVATPWSSLPLEIAVPPLHGPQPAPRVLVLGYTQSGKTTVARMLCEEFGCEGPANVSDQMRLDCEDHIGTKASREMLYHWGRAYEIAEPTYWVRRALVGSPIVTAHMPEDVLKACVEEGLFDAYVWVSRDGAERCETDPLHYGEWALEVPASSYVIDNDGTLDQLQAKAAEVSKRLRDQQGKGEQ
jgi:hypothetical protein